MGTRAEYRPWEDCPQKDRVLGTIVTDLGDGWVMFLPDWRKRKGWGPMKVWRYNLYTI